MTQIKQVHLRLLLALLVKSFKGMPTMLSINPFTLPYVTYRNKAKLPDSSGVYYVLNRYKHEIIYIGRAKNIKNRWQSHHRNWDIEILESIWDDDRIIIAWENWVENHLKELETRRIQQLKPILNWKDEASSDLYLYGKNDWENSPSYWRKFMSSLLKGTTATYSKQQLNYWKSKPCLLEAIDYQHSVTRQTIYRYKYLEQYCLFYYPVNVDKDPIFADNANRIYEVINDDLRAVMQYSAPSVTFDCSYLSEQKAIVTLDTILGHLIDAGIKATDEVFSIQDFRTCFLREIYEPSTKTCFLWMLRPSFQRLAKRKWETICSLTLDALEEGLFPIPEHNYI